MLGSICDFAELFQAQGRNAEAEPILLEAAEHSASANKMERLHRRRIIERLARFYAAWNKAAPDPATLARAAEWSGKLADFDLREDAIPE
jgi:hypothetical protein